MKKCYPTIVTLLFFVCSVAFAQEEMQAKKMENPEWYEVVTVNFKEGKSTRGKEIITDYFMKAAKESESGPVMLLNMRTGSEDLLLIWKMSGLDEMNWEISPESAAWFNSLSKMMGGKEKAQELYDEYITLVDDSSSTLALNLMKS